MPKGKHPCPKCGAYEIEFGQIKRNGVHPQQFFQANNGKKGFSNGIPVMTWVCTTCGFLQSGVAIDALNKHLR